VVGLRVPENFLYYLSLHRQANERLLSLARDYPAREIELAFQPKQARISKMVFEVMGEVHRMKAFVRLSPLGEHVLYGFLQPRHRIEEHICDHFARRNEGTIVVLGSGSESWVALCRRGGVYRDRGPGLTETVQRLKKVLPDCGEVGEQESNVEELWQVYYDSQYCRERKNVEAFKSHMPRRDQESAGLRLVQGRRETTLDEFLEIK